MLHVFGKQILKYFDNNIAFEKYQRRFSVISKYYRQYAADCNQNSAFSLLFPSSFL